MRRYTLLMAAVWMLGISPSSHATVEAIAVGLVGTNSYVVPQGKTLIIEYLFCYVNDEALGYPGYASTVCFIPPGGSQEFLIDAFSVDGTNSAVSYRMAMKFPSGTAIKCWGDFDTLSFTGLLVDSYDLYASRGSINDMSIGDNTLSMSISGPPGQRSNVSIESTGNLLGAGWRREPEAIITQTAKGSSVFGVEVPVSPASQTYYRARFRTKE